MRQRLERKLFVIICIFLVTGAFVYAFSKPSVSITKPPLVDHFQKIDGYSITHQLALDKKAVSMLELDDYIYAVYKKGHNIINLYIGYYFSSDKAYSAHSPLVCYPSQGWKIEQGPTPLDIKVPPYVIHCDEIITAYDQKKEIVLYWYQARQYTNTRVYENKIDLGYNKLVKNDEQHGFVRISAPLQGGMSQKEARSRVIDFVRAFYPEFMRYLLTEG